MIKVSEEEKRRDLPGKGIKKGVVLNVAGGGKFHFARHSRDSNNFLEGMRIKT